MRAFLLAALVLIIAMDDADARRRRHHHRSYAVEIPPDLGSAPEFDTDRRGRGRRPSRNGPPTVAALVPPGWQLEAQNPNWNGKRFLSPDGTSWLAVYRSATDDEPIYDHMRNIIFAKDETITYLRGERAWVAVSGFKDSRIFYRKAILACAGKSWHHIALEYPAELKTRMDALVASAARALDNTQTDCAQSVSASHP